MADSLRQLIEQAVVFHPLPSIGATPNVFLTTTVFADWELQHENGDEMVAGNISFMGGIPANFRLVYWSETTHREVIYANGQIYFVSPEVDFSVEEIDFIIQYLIPLMAYAPTVGDWLLGIGIGNFAEQHTLNLDMGNYTLTDLTIMFRQIDKQVIEVIINLIDAEHTLYQLNINFYGYNAPFEIISP